MICKHFSGEWILIRNIVDYKNSEEYVATGAVVFEPAGISDGNVKLKLLENGQLRSSKSHDLIDFDSSYFIEIDEQHKQLRVLFADSEKVFFSLDLKDSKVKKYSINHECADDTYRGEIILHSPQSIAVNWSVQGPNKNYEMLSNYQAKAVAAAS